jgi:Zn-dependent protease with chaperone function
MSRLIITALLSVAGLLPYSAIAERIEPISMTPLIAPGYEAEDADERGLWQAFDKLEEQIATSNLIVRDPELTSYLNGVMYRLLGEPATDIRLYVIRNPDFNASMAPNGMMIVHTGLLARMRNEAQLAAVLGHEAGHYYRRHSVQQWRSIKAKTALMSVIALGGAAASGGAGNGNWYDLANAVNVGLLASIFKYGRTHEQEADAFGLKLLAEGQYSPHEASNVWGQLIAEREASAEARNKRYKDRSRSAFSTHPPTESRMVDLRLSADELLPGILGDDASRLGFDSWVAGTRAIRQSLIEEQVKLNDSGASLYLINGLAESGWSTELRYFLGQIYSLRGEEGDGDLAAQAYAEAVQFPKPIPEAFRAHGYARLKAGYKQEGNRALAQYLDLRPDAPDAAMTRFTIGEF